MFLCREVTKRNNKYQQQMLLFNRDKLIRTKFLEEKSELTERHRNGKFGPFIYGCINRNITTMAFDDFLDDS